FPFAFVGLGHRSGHHRRGQGKRGQAEQKFLHHCLFLLIAGTSKWRFRKSRTNSHIAPDFDKILSLEWENKKSSSSAVARFASGRALNSITRPCIARAPRAKWVTKRLFSTTTRKRFPPISTLATACISSR